MSRCTTRKKKKEEKRKPKKYSKVKSTRGEQLNVGYDKVKGISF